MSDAIGQRGGDRHEKCAFASFVLAVAFLPSIKFLLAPVSLTKSMIMRKGTRVSSPFFCQIRSGFMVAAPL